MRFLLPVPLTFRLLQERIQVNTKEFDMKTFQQRRATTTIPLAIFTL
jgi:hypothetical protein